MKAMGREKAAVRRRDSCIQTALGILALIFCSAGSLWAGATLADRAVEKRVERLESGLQAQKSQLNDARIAARQQLDTLADKVTEMHFMLVRLETWQTTLGPGYTASFQPATLQPEQRLSSRFVSMQDLTLELDRLGERVGRLAQELSRLADDVTSRGARILFVPSGWPSDSRTITSHRGYRKDPFTGKRQWHKGIDIDGREGDPIYAVAAGVVTWSGPRSTYGGLVEIGHADGYASRYAHTSINLVSVGDFVQRGEVIARIGKTGRATGNSLHFEILKHGRTVDPMPYLSVKAGWQREQVPEA